MMERGFLEVKSFKDIINGRGKQPLIKITPSQTVSDAISLMKKYDIENIPVMKGGIILGAISESGLFNKIINNADIKTQLIESVMEKPYPIVAFDTPVERLSSFITKENGAVLSKDESGSFHIVTKYDIIQGTGTIASQYYTIWLKPLSMLHLNDAAFFISLFVVISGT
jgi:cystathionine beta-synthase